MEQLKIQLELSRQHLEELTAFCERQEKTIASQARELDRMTGVLQAYEKHIEGLGNTIRRDYGKAN